MTKRKQETTKAVGAEEQLRQSFAELMEGDDIWYTFENASEQVSIRPGKVTRIVDHKKGVVDLVVFLSPVDFPGRYPYGVMARANVQWEPNAGLECWRWKPQRGIWRNGHDT